MKKVTRKLLNKLTQDRMFFDFNLNGHCFPKKSKLSALKTFNINNNLTNISKNNIVKLENLLKCQWKYIIQYKNIRDNNGFLLYGYMSDNKLINYHRYNPNQGASNQTCIHVNGRLQVHRLISDFFPSTDNCFRDLKNIKKLCNDDNYYDICYHLIEHWGPPEDNIYISSTLQYHMLLYYERLLEDFAEYIQNCDLKFTLEKNKLMFL